MIERSSVAGARRSRARIAPQDAPFRERIHLLHETVDAMPRLSNFSGSDDRHLPARIARRNYARCCQIDPSGAVGSTRIDNPYGDPGDREFGSGIAAGDFDGNGIGDLANTGDSSEHMRVLRGLP